VQQPDPDDIPTSVAEQRRLDALVRGLNQSQAEAVTLEHHPLRILAGAGSGKTRVLTHRIAHRALTGSLDPERVLAVTFTRKAAGELRERLGRLGLRSGVHAGTFHSIAYAQLRQRWQERGVRPPELLERKVGFIARLMGAGRGSTAPLDVVAEIEWAAARRVGPDHYAEAAELARRRPPLPLERVGEIYQRYMDDKRRRRLVDFDDLLRLAARDLAADPVYQAGRHWRFRHLFVDEFQDVNPLQHHLLSAWMGPESDLCVVGDPNQAIYAWNGADARYLVDFSTYFPGARTVTLEDNYRSTPQVLTVANAVLAAGHNVPLRLRPHRESGATPTVSHHEDETAEANALARRARDHHPPGSSWSDQAVLVRTNAQAAVIAEAFTRLKVPHRIRGGGDLLEQPEIRQAMNTLRRGSSLPMALADLSDEIRRAREPGSSGAPPSLTEERAANLDELVRLGHEYLALDPEGGTAGLTGWLRSTLRGEDGRGGDAVDIVTFHAAKGLEWPVVHLAGLEEGYVPIHHARDDDATEEERRLLYVALTRARDELHCTWATSRTFGARTANRKPSPWLSIIESTLGMTPTRVDPARGAARARSARSALSARPRSGPDAARFEALRQWRRSQARDADVPAFVIFNDATLHELAARRPRTEAQLLSVPGVGPVKAQRFGPAVLEILADTEDSTD